MTARRWLVVATVLACAVGWYAAAPPSPILLTVGPDDPPLVRGAIHVHSRQSDGTGSAEDIAAAAARAGLQFVILTDHGDATRAPRAPVYFDGVLSIDAVEISAEGGHVVALDLSQSPYPLGGELRDVLADVERLGGMAIAAHPGSPRVDLRWAEWDGSFGGLEWLNADSEWRDETWMGLARALFSYPIRPAPTLAGLFDRPLDVLQRWDELTQRRPVVAVAGSDAHARVSVRGGEGSTRSAIALPLPTYEQLFRTLSVTVTGVELVGSALDDARAVLEALRSGRVYSTIDALAGPVSLDFRAVSGATEATAGDRLPVDGPTVFRVVTNAPAGARVTLLQNGAVVADTSANTLELSSSAPGTYRVELHLARAPGVPPVPWVVSNPIYLGVGEGASTAAPLASPVATRSVYADGPPTAWRVESSPRSQGVLDVVASTNGTQLTLRYGLGGAASEGQHVAAVVPVEGDLDTFDRLTFSAAAFRPMRISVQFRTADDRGERRWQRSVYVDETPRAHTVAFGEMRSIDSEEDTLVLAEVQDLLFVIDTVHSAPGSSGQLWLDDVAFAR